jgi:ArsR family transcriptional regulator, arsenate/arsenite/antimonite-responsive transcriptional repressor
MKTPDAVTVLKALAQESRLAAFRALVQAGEEGLPVGDLRELLDIPAATLSAHLNVLRQADLVSDVREGRVIRVSANYTAMNTLIRFLTENCCAGSKESGRLKACA